MVALSFAKEEREEHGVAPGDPTSSQLSHHGNRHSVGWTARSARSRDMRPWSSFAAVEDADG